MCLGGVSCLVIFDRLMMASGLSSNVGDTYEDIMCIRMYVLLALVNFC